MKDPFLNYQYISICDNGIGIDEKYATKIFDIFQRLHGNAEYERTGIGLATCKKIMDNHKGFIRATGAPEKGMCIHLYLPMDESDHMGKKIRC